MGTSIFLLIFKIINNEIENGKYSVIDHKSHSEEQAFCSCIAEIEVDIPDDMLSAKYLVLDQWRRSVKTIVFKE